MTTEIQLTDTQRQVLEHAAGQADGRLVWFPDTVKGGARKKVLDGLFHRALVTADGADWFLTAAGYDALGLERPTASPAPEPLVVDPQTDVAGTAAEAQRTGERAETKRRTRENSKQAQVIAMLQRAEGATIAQICAVTDWQPHTVRGAFAGAFKNKLGLTIVSEKPAGGERVYRIAR